jgi:hydroxymethylpyrimidine/phosphomethylpyrimidine kinase
MVAQSGDKLLQDDAVEALKRHLFPLAEIITPNLPEAAVLLGREVAGAADMESAAADLLQWGCRHVLVKGGHLDGDGSEDVLVSAGSPGAERFGDERIQTRNTHGTGCTLSSAIAAHLAKGEGVTEAVGHAKEYIRRAIRAGADYRIGHGHGPVHHFWPFWE